MHIYMYSHALSSLYSLFLIFNAMIGSEESKYKDKKEKKNTISELWICVVTVERGPSSFKDVWYDGVQPCML